MRRSHNSDHQRSMRNAAKRAIDVFGAGVLLILTSPILFAAFIGIRFVMGSPLLFRQQRAGIQGKVFVLYKLRTMTEGRDGYGVLLPAPLRFTLLGRWLRRFSVDELPQLWNVLKGDMSLIGPRPLLASYLPRYSSLQLRRHEVLPGITGWAQISGRNSLTWEEKFSLDVWYVDHWSLLLDFRILARTLWTVCSARGTIKAGSPEECEFAGIPEPYADHASSS